VGSEKNRNRNLKGFKHVGSNRNVVKLHKGRKEGRKEERSEQELKCQR
jgi:hypothetical protein